MDISPAGGPLGPLPLLLHVLTACTCWERCCEGLASATGKGASSPRATPFGKRLRSPPGATAQHAGDPWRAAATCGTYDDAALDNVRSQKRYLSEVPPIPPPVARPPMQAPLACLT